MVIYSIRVAAHLNTRESSLAAKARDCKSPTKKHRRFESFFSHKVDKLNQNSIKQVDKFYHGKCLHFDWVY